jgi:transcriptional regulator with XRE-family HTH domain
MRGDETYDEHMVRLLRDPEFAAEWETQAPLRHFPLNVWSLRESSGMTQQQLAHAAKMKQPRIAEIERGDGNPTLLTISRIAFALGVSADRLLAKPDEALLAKAREMSVTAANPGSRGRRTAKARAEPDPAQPQGSPPRAVSAGVESMPRRAAR